MKKIDVFILKSFLGPFIAALFIGDIILVLQFFWVLVDQLAGKGLDLGHIFQFTIYLATIMLSKALPVAILVSSIMTYGNLSETSEITAFRAAGLSFARISRPIGIFSILLAVFAFFINNTMVPFANLKLISLRYDIFQAKPAFSLQEGVFYTDLNDFVILAEKKESDNRHIEGIVIYQQTKSEDNLIIANKGIMETPNEQKYLRFILQNGYYYQYDDEANNNQFITFQFGKYVKDFSLWKFTNTTNDSLFTYVTSTQGEAELRKTKREQQELQRKEWTELEGIYMGNFPLMERLLRDSLPLAREENIKAEDLIMSTSDDISASESVFNSFFERFISSASSIKGYEKREREAIVEWNEKFIYSLICIAFFLIGAPIGSIIKRGGLGLPFVFAISFFVLFVFSDAFGQKFSKGVTGPNPYVGVWASFVIFLLIGIVLFLRITGFDPIKKIRRLFYNT